MACPMCKTCPKSGKAWLLDQQQSSDPSSPEDLRALLQAWGYSNEEIEAAIKEFDAALE
jgi:hypothetical protein